MGSKAPNELGLYDMSGNVWEWCSDWYDEKYYASSSSSNPTGPASGQYRIVRGGSWFNNPMGTRISVRAGALPETKSSDGGFRLACSD